MLTMMRGIIDWADENEGKSIILYITPEDSDKKLMMSEASVIYEDVSDKDEDEIKKTLRGWMYKGDPGKYKINMHKEKKRKCLDTILFKCPVEVQFIKQKEILIMHRALMNIVEMCVISQTWNTWTFRGMMPQGNRDELLKWHRRQKTCIK